MFWAVFCQYWPPFFFPCQLLAPILCYVRPSLYTFAKLLVDSAEFGDSNVGDDGTLPTRIPWSRNDHKELRKYNSEIEALTKNYIAHKNVVAPISSGFALNMKDKKKTLQDYLDNWGDSGPHGTGAH